MLTANTTVVSSFFLWSRENGEDVTLGDVRSHSSRPAGAIGGIFHVTEDRATAKLWASELAAGRAPSSTEENAPKHAP